MKAAARTPERLKRHYEVEKALADRLRAARTREERAAIYETMYDELFAEVPDHPRLSAPKTVRDVERINAQKLRLVEPFLGGRMRVADIGAGDCSFAIALCDRVREVVAVDITEKSARIDGAPDNFTLVVYDGFHLPLEGGSVDLALSDQLVEHLHPDDAEWHFRMILDVLAPGGSYVFRTPHRFTGPHDVSRFFTKGEPEGFHLKEWTFGELGSVLRRIGYRRVTGFWSARGRSAGAPVGAFSTLESVLGVLPRALRAPLSRVALPTILVAARK